MINKIIVVGGGAAGMMAAIVAKRNGSDVTLLERNDRIGKKLLATGNGRCNYTNLNINLNNYHGQDISFIENALSELNVDKTIEFFEQLGITPADEDNGKVFPLSFQASSMLDVLRYELKYLGVELITEAYVVDICRKKKFVVKLKDGRDFTCDKVILAAGGMAMPVSGSDGNGYSLAKSLGHTVTDIFPGLVQLKLEGNIFKQVNGVKFIGTASVYHKNELLAIDSGDILFTDYGISGPPILQISRKAIEFMNDGKEVELKISIINSRSKEELTTYLCSRFVNMPMKTIEEALIGLINKRLILPVLKELNIDKNLIVSDLSYEEVMKISELLTSWSFKVIGNKGWGQAQVTAGGVNTSEIDSKTMESKIVDGLYIIGELLDIDGDCGGFNLQWAWSSGYVSGLNAAK
ncbi:NAD(P)/FAD-dependent oxidoreductase [Tissierella sp. Yu-01]|uniref:NAD(P)/FAD-dependent oxidoreductase n=1 Tax=Tissierella sp. Yu-01 TaxID=3035694 RepID=UPI00240D21D6|nr:NAD(P)/FAD-dependent oxidoreductase [Tissierella sp. Yu-01]WFA07707.1 NAD(P)/FAD-dependent oxidoreductase [Tissierella sp. Yu-01]